MKPSRAPDVPGNTPWERLDSAVHKVFNVSKDALVKEEIKRKRSRARKRKQKAQ